MCTAYYFVPNLTQTGKVKSPLIQHVTYFLNIRPTVTHTVSLRPPTAAAQILSRTGPFDIRCRQVALVQVFIQMLPLSTVSRVEMESDGTW